MQCWCAVRCHASVVLPLLATMLVGTMVCTPYLAVRCHGLLGTGTLHELSSWVHHLSAGLHLAVCVECLIGKRVRGHGLLGTMVGHGPLPIRSI